MPNQDYSTEQISSRLISQIVDALQDKAFGSVEIFIEDYTVTQITERKITKTSRQVRLKPTRVISTRTKFSQSLQ